MSDYIEHEFKYKSDNISLTDFKKLMKKLPIVRKLEVSSWDYYLVNENKSFIRFRNSSEPEITTKLKTSENNNFKRLEVNLALDHNKVSKDSVFKFAELLGYRENFRIFKTCFVFFLDKVNYVFYNVFDENMKEVGRYIEVEINEGSGGDQSHLDEAASKLKEIGLTPQQRMKKSLFELYYKEKN